MICLFMLDMQKMQIKWKTLTYAFYDVTLYILYHLIKQHPGEPSKKSIRLGMDGLLVCDSPPAESLCCILEQDTLSVCLFDLILYVPSTIFQLNRDESSWVEPVLSYDKCVML